MMWPHAQVKGAVSYIERRRAAVSMANDVAFKAGLQASTSAAHWRADVTPAGQKATCMYTA